MWLVIGDLHLTDHARDQYRFGIFKWIRQQQEKYKPAATFLLGDLTDSKDRHSAILVNKIVNGLTSLSTPVYILEGNHDYKADKKNPFFRFLNHIEGLQFITEPTVITAVRPIALIPHCRSQDDFDRSVNMVFGRRRANNPACLLVHQTFEGAIAESGVRLSGLSASLVESFKPPLGIYAGDVHRPQTQGMVTYVGCPYQVRFGDDFEPRSLYVCEHGKSQLYFDAPMKWSLTVRSAEDVHNSKLLIAGDQVKLTIQMAREEAVGWKKVKSEVLAACRELKLEVFGAKLEVKSHTHERLRITQKQTEPADILEAFCKAENVSIKIKKKGLEIINGT